MIEDGFEREREIEIEIGEMAFNGGAHDTLHQRPLQIVVKVRIPFSSASNHLQPQLSSKQLVVVLNQVVALNQG